MGTGRRARRALRWVAASPAERATLPAAAGCVATGAILHAAGAPTLDVALASAVAAPGVMYGAVLRAARSGPTAAKAAAGTVAAGAWLTAASRYGALAGPDHLSGWLALAGTGVGYAVLRHDAAVRSRRRLRSERASWRAMAHRIGLAGSLLVRQEATRLGRRLDLDVRGTGRRASSVACPGTAEIIAEVLSLPPSRVQVSRGRVAGRVVISIRERDPWERPVPHPLLDPFPEIALDAVASVRGPLVIGIDPETGEPLSLRLWDEEGARRVVLVGTSGGGKTVAMSDATERLTACPDAVAWSINVSKGREDRYWAPAFGLTAAGPHEREKALAILRMARAVVDWRGAAGTTAVHQPSPQAPLVVVRIDEMHALFRGTDDLAVALREEGAYLASTGRSEGVGLLGATQRGTARQMGGADVRANIATVGILKMRDENEMRLAAGEFGADLPNMAEYGEGNAGVIALTDFDGSAQAGRTFYLKELDDIARLADGRTPPELEPELVAHLGREYAALRDGTWPPALTVAPGFAPVPAAASLAQRMGRVSEANASTRAAVALLDDPADGVAPEVAQRAASLMARRRDDAARAVEVPAEMRQALLVLLRSPGGTSVRRAGAALRVPGATAYQWLERLRVDGLAEVRGKGRGAGFHATGPDDDPNVCAPPHAGPETFEPERFPAAS